jgi:hypothetical protein
MCTTISECSKSQKCRDPDCKKSHKNGRLCCNSLCSDSTRACMCSDIHIPIGENLCQKPSCHGEWTVCSRNNQQVCPKYHITVPCEFGPECMDYSCAFSHFGFICKRGMTCKRFDCPFEHPYGHIQTGEGETLYDAYLTCGYDLYNEWENAGFPDVKQYVIPLVQAIIDAEDHLDYVI